MWWKYRYSVLTSTQIQVLVSLHPLSQHYFFRYKSRMGEKNWCSNNNRLIIESWGTPDGHTPSKNLQSSAATNRFSSKSSWYVCGGSWSCSPQTFSLLIRYLLNEIPYMDFISQYRALNTNANCTFHFVLWIIVLLFHIYALLCVCDITSW